MIIIIITVVIVIITPAELAIQQTNTFRFQSLVVTPSHSSVRHGCQAGSCAHVWPELSATATFGPECVIHHQHCSPLVNKKHNKTRALTPSLLRFYFLFSPFSTLHKHFTLLCYLGAELLSEY